MIYDLTGEEEGKIFSFKNLTPALTLLVCDSNPSSHFAGSRSFILVLTITYIRSIAFASLICFGYPPIGSLGFHFVLAVSVAAAAVVVVCRSLWKSDIYGPTIIEKELECIVVVSYKTVRGALEIDEASLARAKGAFVVNLSEDYSSSTIGAMIKLKSEGSLVLSCGVIKV